MPNGAGERNESTQTKFITSKDGVIHGFYIYVKKIDTYRKQQESRNGDVAGYRTEWYT